jgi:hypothetical protein
MTRRTALALFSAALARAANKVPANKNVKWALGANLWNSFPRVPFTDILDVMKDTGFIGIRLTQFPQILTTYNITAAQMRAECEKRGCHVITISFNGATYDPEQHTKVLAAAKTAMIFLKEFDAKHLVVFPPNRRFLNEASFKAMCECFNKIGETAGEMGFKAGLHNHMDEMVQTAEEIDRCMAMTDPKLFRDHVGENKPVSLDDLTHPDRKRSVKNRGSVNERMKFSVLSARIDSGRQLIEELLIEIPAYKKWSETFRIHAGELRPEPARNHVSRQVASVQIPEREQGFQSSTPKLPLAVSANISKEQIAESHGLDSGFARPHTNIRHDLFVLLVRTRPRDRNRLQRQSCRLGLGFQQLAPHRVHGYSIEGFVQCCEQSNHFEVRILTKYMERPGAIFATAPGKQHSLHRFTSSHSGPTMFRARS